MTTIRLLLTAAMMLEPAGAYAQEVMLDEVVVAVDAEARALEERRESATSKTVITRKEMGELGGQTAADVLRRLPRLFFSGPPSTNKDIRMNGLDKEFQNILINGNRPPGGGEKREFALDRIPVEQIERMEVYKSPNASHDADAVAGFVNIILKRPPQERSISVSAGGSLNDRARRLGDKLTAGFGDRFGPLGLQAGGTRNDEFRGKDKTVSDSARNETESETEVVRTLTTSGLLDLELRLGERDRLSLHPLLSDQTESKDKDRLVKNRATGANKSLNREREVKYATLESFAADWEHRFKGGSVLKLEGSWAMNEENKEKKTAQFTGAALPFTKDLFEDERKQDRDRTAAVELKSPWSGPWRTEHALSMGLKWRDKDRRVNKSNWEISPAGVRTDKTVADDSYRVDETIVAAFIMDEASLTEKLVLTPGVRVEATDGGYRSGGGRSARGDFVDWNPSIHALYRVRDSLQARASAGRTISRPAFRDKVPTRSVKADKVEEGNPDLDAARSVNVEAGLEQYLGKNGLIAAGGFYKRINGVIEKQTTGIDAPTGLPLVRPRNAGAADVVGAEFEAKTTLELIGLPEATVLANYTRQYAHVKDAATGQRRRLKDNPEDIANLIGRWDAAGSGFSASVGLNYVGEMVDETIAPTKVTAPFLQWDASVKQRLGRGVSVYASVLNLFDELKVKDDGLRREEERAGRTFYFGLSMEF